MNYKALEKKAHENNMLVTIPSSCEGIIITFYCYYRDNIREFLYPNIKEAYDAIDKLVVLRARNIE